MKCSILFKGVLFKNLLLKNAVLELSPVPLNYKNLQLASFSLSLEAVRKHREKGTALCYHSDASVAFRTDNRK